jgi:predicted Zn-dependent peptidase
MKYIKKVLPNGLTVILVPSQDAESVVVDFFVKTGSRSETGKENGISHFLEHFLFKGTKKYPNAKTISELVDAIGGEMNANTGKEHTQYFIKADSKHLPMIFEILTDMIQQPLLDPQELKREKGVIVEEINMYKDSPIATVENLAEETMWPKDALGRDIAGSRDTVTKFSRPMFLSYLKRHYQTPNMLIGISGKFDNQKVNSLIRKHWLKVKKNSFHKWDKARDVQTSPRLALQFKQTEQAHLVLGFKGFDFNDKRNYAAGVLSAILGGGMSSRLFTEVRERRGLAYYVRAASGNYQDTGVFNVRSGVQVPKIQEAITVILSELAKMKTELVDYRELLKAKEYIKGHTILMLEDNQSRLDWYLESAAFNRNIETPKEYFAKIDKVTARDIQKVANDLFHKNSMTLAIIGPYKKQAPFRKLLKI